MPAFKNWIKRCLGKLKCRLEGHLWTVDEDRYYCSRCGHLGADWEWHELTPEEEDIVIELYNQDPYIKLKDWISKSKYDLLRKQDINYGIEKGYFVVKSGSSKNSIYRLFKLMQQENEGYFIREIRRLICSDSYYHIDIFNEFIGKLILPGRI